MTDPQTAADAAERVQAYLDARRAIGDTRKTIASAEPDPCAIPARIVRLIEADVRTLLADRKRMAAELEQVRGAVVEAAELLNRLAAPDPCEIDSDGSCWAHEGRMGGYLAPCPHPLGRRFVEAWRTVQAEATERSDAEDATAASARPAGGSDGTGEGQRTGTPVREAQRGSQGRAEFESFLTDASRRAVAEFFAEAAQESDDFDIDAVIAQNHADAARDWGLDDGPTR